MHVNQDEANRSRAGADTSRSCVTCCSKSKSKGKGGVLWWEHGTSNATGGKKRATRGGAGKVRRAIIGTTDCGWPGNSGAPCTPWKNILATSLLPPKTCSSRTHWIRSGHSRSDSLHKRKDGSWLPTCRLCCLSPPRRSQVPNLKSQVASRKVRASKSQIRHRAALRRRFFFFFLFFFDRSIPGFAL